MSSREEQEKEERVLVCSAKKYFSIFVDSILVKTMRVSGNEEINRLSTNILDY